MLEHKIDKNKFVDFCNGDVKGEDTETLNHFDEHTRYQFTRMLYAYGTGMTGQNPFANDEEVEITADIDSATHTSFYVNGQKAFTAITGMSYLPSEIQTFGTIQQPFKTRGYKPYDPGTNSITIGVGSRFNLGNGYSMTVQEDFVWGEGYGNGSKADDERCNMIIGGLNTLIHFADQQYFSSMTDPYTDYILDFLASQGVDTSREFVINGTHGELAGCDPAIMGIGPVYSTRKVMKKLGMEIGDFDLIEANEAFAAQSVAVGKDLGFDLSKLNVNGGAIALGHPVGCSGARILVSLLYEMQKEDVHTGLATLCVGGGMGCSAVVKRD